MKCPRCSSVSMYLSKSGNARLGWPLRLLIVRVRCHDCSKQFLRRGLLALGKRVPPHKMTAATEPHAGEGRIIWTGPLLCLSKRHRAAAIFLAESIRRFLCDARAPL